jgi:hypothetical protein
MVIWELFSKREKKKKLQGQEDVFQYESLPSPFRVQVVNLWDNALGNHRRTGRVSIESKRWWDEIFNIFTNEQGVFCLTSHEEPAFHQFRAYFMKASTEEALDMIELTFRVIDRLIRSLPDYERAGLVAKHPDDAIAELNYRFREHGIGYEFAEGEIIRVDSKFIHAEVVKPALQLLHDCEKDFSGALDEFLGAHERYRKGETKDAVAWALKAFESTMKAICMARSWPYDPTKATAKDLLHVLYANGLVPTYLQNSLSGLRSVLESVPTVRNKTSGHGQGTTPTDVPGHLAAYVLQMTASNIVFLIEWHKANQ